MKYLIDEPRDEHSLKAMNFYILLKIWLKHG